MLPLHFVTPFMGKIKPRNRLSGMYLPSLYFYPSPSRSVFSLTLDSSLSLSHPLPPSPLRSPPLPFLTQLSLLIKVLVWLSAGISCTCPVFSVWWDWEWDGLKEGNVCLCVILCAGDTQVHQDYFRSKYPWSLKEPSPDALLFMPARVSTRSLWCQGASRGRKRRREDGKQSEEEGQMWGSGKNIHSFLFLFAVSCEHSTSEHKTGEPFCRIYVFIYTNSLL